MIYFLRQTFLVFAIAEQAVSWLRSSPALTCEVKLSWKAFTVLKYVLLLLLVDYMLYALSKASPSPLPRAVLSCNWGHQHLQRKRWDLICTGFGRWERQGKNQMCNGRILFLSLQIGVIGISPLLSFLYSRSKEFLLSHFCFEFFLSTDVQGIFLEQYFSVVP